MERQTQPRGRHSSGQRTWGSDGSWDLCVVAQQHGQWPLQACCEGMLLQWDGSSLLLGPWFSPCRMLFWGPCGKQQRNSKWLLFSYSQKEPVFVESCYSGSHDFLFIVNFIVPFFSVASRCLAGTGRSAPSPSNRDTPRSSGCKEFAAKPKLHGHVGVCKNKKTVLPVPAHCQGKEDAQLPRIFSSSVSPYKVSRWALPKYGV